MIDGTTEARVLGGYPVLRPGKSGFRIDVESGLCQYVCSFLG